MADNRAAGFTLIEVLVALVVFSIGVMALFHVRGEAVRSVALLQERTFASIVAENRMAETVASVAPLTLGETAGVAPLAGRDWRWSEQILETPNPGMRRIEISVRSEKGETVLAALTGFRGVP